MRKVNSKDIKYIATISFVGVLIVGAYVYTHRSQAQENTSIVVAKHDVEQRVDLTGQVASFKKHDLSFAGSGIVQKIYIEEGQAVTAGQIIAKLDVSDVAMQRAQAKAVLEGDRLTADINLQKAQQVLSTTLVSDKQKLAQARQAVADAKAVYDTAQNNLNDFSEPDQNSPTYGSYLSIKQAAVSTKATYNAAQKNLNVLNATIKQGDATSTLDLAGATATRQLKQDTINAAGDMSANRANLGYLDAMLNKSVLRAPVAGIATLVDVTEGEFATPAKPVVTVESMDLQIIAQASQLNVDKIKVGDKAQVTMDATGTDTNFTASVVSIGTSETLLGGNVTYKVTLKFDKNDTRIKSGMTANVSIFTLKHTDVVAVPKQIVLQNRGVSTVIVDRGNTQEKRVVTVGISGADGYVEITNGLQVGERVLSFSTK